MPLFLPPLPQPWIVESVDWNGSAAAGTGLATNVAYLYPFVLYTTTTFTGMKLDAGTIASSLAVDVGIYDSAGANLLVHTATPAVALTASQVNSVSFSANLTLNPGRYIMACCLSNNTDQIFRKTAMPPGMAGGYTSTNAPANAGTATCTLPATTGTLVVAGAVVAMQLIVSGGAP